ncbi:MAG: molybdenum cofactor guanylyltransferase [Proteobacteria bacterium]|nr:molybdenum cofactor guanylyltransferase [Pseudomonadota bacterium]
MAAHLVKDVSGVVLAGGRSIRYGKNKALVKVRGVPLIERVLDVMGSVFHRVIIITNMPNQYSYLKLPMYEDIIKGLGPLGGVFTGLKVIPDDAGFFVACDMPFLNRDLIRYIIEVRADADAVVPRIAGKMEALHAVYAKRCQEKIEDLINSRTYQIIRFFSQVSVRFVDEDEVRLFDPDFKSFLNINRPDELKRF